MYISPNLHYIIVVFLRKYFLLLYRYASRNHNKTHHREKQLDNCPVICAERERMEHVN